MKYIFCSFMFDDVEENIKNSKFPNSVSGHKFQQNMLGGLLDNNCDVEVVNVPRVRRYPDYKKIIINEKKFKYGTEVLGTSVGCINLFCLNYITQVINVYYHIKRIIEENTKQCIVLVVFNTYPALAIAMCHIKKKYPNVILCDVIGDIYGKFGLSSQDSLYGKMIDYIHDKMDSMAKEFDVFGLATENMAVALNIADKPHVVIEGMYKVTEPVKALKEQSGINNKKIIFYAGAVLKEYGIEHLLRSFLLIKNDSYRLYIAGQGDAVEVVKEYENNDHRIKYLGFITPNEVDYYQSIATVLVNPRTSEYEYIKYSFASKNLECLASGVPYIAHNLECNPIEYSKYIQYPEDESDLALANKMVEIIELPRYERELIGQKGKEFIVKQKNPKMQMSKVCKLLISAENNKLR